MSQHKYSRFWGFLAFARLAFACLVDPKEAEDLALRALKLRRKARKRWDKRQRAARKAFLRRNKEAA